MTFAWIHFLRMATRKMVRNLGAEFPNARDRRVMRRGLLKPLDAGPHNRLRRVEIRLADFQVNDATTLPL